jgi:hypothetical protein
MEGQEMKRTVWNYANMLSRGNLGLYRSKEDLVQFLAIQDIVSLRLTAGLNQHRIATINFHAAVLDAPVALRHAKLFAELMD